MKKISVMVIIAFFFCFLSSALAGVEEKLEKIGFPEEATASLARLVERKSFSEKIDIQKGLVVSALVREDKVETNVKMNWPGEYKFQAEKYATGDFVLYRLINQGREIFFRIGDLPRLIPETPVALPATSPQQEEEKVAEKPVEEKPLTPIQKTAGDGVEEIYEASAIPLDFVGINQAQESMTAIVIPIYRSYWIGDGLGMYTVTEKDGKEVEKFLVRKVWRAYVGNEIFPAIITKFGTHLFVVAQGKTKIEVLGKNVVIISGSGKFALTLSGNMTKFNIKEFEESAEYQKTFFEKNPSEVKEEMLVDISPNTENGKMFLTDLRKIFPNDYYVKGKLVSTEADEEELGALIGLSNNSSYMRRGVEKGGLPNISVVSVACPPCELLRMLIVWTLAAFDNSLSGNFFEAKVSGYQSAQALAPYLAECQEEINYLTKNLTR